MKFISLLAALLLASFASAAPPRLEKHGGTWNLLVHDKPFLILGGELGNSSASSTEYMKPHWPRLAAMNLNTVLAPVLGAAGAGRGQVRLGADGGAPLVGIDIAEEGVFVDGNWQPGRRLNGDQTHQGRHIRLPPGNPQIQKVRLYRY